MAPIIKRINKYQNETKPHQKRKGKKIQIYYLPSFVIFLIDRSSFIIQTKKSEKNASFKSKTTNDELCATTLLFMFICQVEP